MVNKIQSSDNISVNRRSCSSNNSKISKLSKQHFEEDKYSDHSDNEKES